MEGWGTLRAIVGSWVVLLACSAMAQDAGAPEKTDPRLAQLRRLAEEAGKQLAAGRDAEALALLEKVKALEVDLYGAGHENVADTLTWQAQVHECLGDDESARTALEHALQIQTKLHGKNHWKTGDARREVSALDFRSGLAREDRSQLQRANRLDQRRLALFRQGRFQDEIPLGIEALAIRKRILGPSHPDYARSLNNLAMLYRGMGEFSRAEPLIQRALKIYEKALGGSHPHYAASLNGLALLYQATGDFAQAEPLYQKVLDIFEKTLGPSHPNTATSLNNLASLYRTMGALARAEPLLQRALEIREQALGPSHPRYAASLNNLGALYQAMGAFARAEPLSKRALELFEKTLGPSHPYYATSLNHLASLYRAMGDFARAELLYEKALEIRVETLGASHPHYATSLNNLAALYQAKGDLAKAQPLCLEALTIRRGVLDATFAVLSERQQFEMSRMLRDSLDLHLALAASGKSDASEAYAPMLAWKGAVFARQVVARAPAGDAAAAELRAKLESVSRRLAARYLARPKPSQQEVSRRRIQELSEQREQLERELSVRSEAYRYAKAITRLTPAQLKQALPEGVVLVDFLEYERDRKPHLVAFLVRKQGGIRRVDLGLVAPITEQIGTWRKAAAAGRSPQTGLRKLLWEPLATHLKGAKTVLISPDGVLTRLPFGALPGSKPDCYLLEEIAIGVVAVPQLLPALLAHEKRPAPGPASLLLLGDVDYGGDRGAVTTDGRSAPRGGKRAAFARLQATRGEILSVRDSFAQRYEEGTVSMLRRDKATEARLRDQAGRHRWLHLATHGFFAPPSVKSALQGKQVPFGGGQVVGYHPGLLSGLALTGVNRDPQEGEDDGILTALEVASLDLSGVEVVVLSACETGLGAVAGGEGVLGLQRAFQVAGARTTVTSLWKVKDDATRVLMERFYEGLWGEGLPKLEALRRAQLALLNAGRRGLTMNGDRGRGLTMPEESGSPQRVPPLEWAAFVLGGDWR